MSDQSDDDYFVPLVDQRVFGAGIKRKRVAFVPAATPTDEATVSSTSTKSASDKYLSIVFDKQAEKSEEVPVTVSDPPGSDMMTVTCSICGQQVGNDTTSNGSHETSIAHQVCLKHSYPPSHLDRSRTGLRYLQEYGWDPDSRVGLGARQDGIRVPIKAREKKNTAGLGSISDDAVQVGKKTHAMDRKPVMLDAKQIRKMEAENRKKSEKLRQLIYGEDISQYLGTQQ